MKAFTSEKIFWYCAIAALCAAYFFGLRVDVMDVDAAQYASIAREMLHNNSYLQVKHWQGDYLDKPPLLFWLSCLSFHIFGISTVAYKLPSLLFSLLGFYATYRFAKLYYDETAARLSALVLASCQAMILINNDVRTDTLLTASVIFSAWQIAAYMKNGSMTRLLGGSIGIGLAMLAKGPIGLVALLFAFIGNAALNKNFRPLLKWQWLPATLIVALMLLPMCIGLHRQFGWTGVKFFFWTQSFGRITGESEWRNDAGYFYLIPVFLWAFLPWTLIFIRAFFDKAKTALMPGNGNAEFITLSGFTLTFIALSFSRYKLPHYIFVVTPFAAVITGNYLSSLTRNNNILFNMHHFLLLVIWLAAGAIMFFVFPERNIPLWLISLALLCLTGVLILRKQKTPALATLITIAGFNLVMNAHFYPELLKLQPGRQAAEVLKKESIPASRLISYKTSSHALDFYTQTTGQCVYDPELMRRKAEEGVVIYVDEKELEEIKSWSIPFREVASFDGYPVSNLSIGFLNPATRAEKLSKMLLLEF